MKPERCHVPLRPRFPLAEFRGLFDAEGLADGRLDPFGSEGIGGPAITPPRGGPATH
jgi:hypothetical protein